MFQKWRNVNDIDVFLSTSPRAAGGADLKLILIVLQFTQLVHVFDYAPI